MSHYNTFANDSFHNAHANWKQWERYGAHYMPFLSHLKFEGFFQRSEWQAQQQLFKSFIADQQAAYLLISGQQGSGRSSLLGQLLHNHQGSNKYLRICAQTSLTTKWLKLSIQQAWLNSQSTSLSGGYLGPHRLDDLLSLLDGKGTHLIVIDQADRIPYGVLAKIMALYPKDRNSLTPYVVPVKFIFLASPGFCEKLSKLMFKPADDYLTRIDLPNLSAEEMPRYVEHKLKSAGLDPRYKVRPHLIKSIYQRSKGNIGMVNSCLAAYMPSNMFEKKIKPFIPRSQKIKTRYKKSIRILNRFVCYQGVWLIGIFSLGYALVHYQSHFNMRRFIFMQPYGTTLPASMRLAYIKRTTKDMFRANSGYQLVNELPSDGRGDSSDDRGAMDNLPAAASTGADDRAGDIVASDSYIDIGERHPTLSISKDQHSGALHRRHGVTASDNV